MNGGLPSTNFMYRITRPFNDTEVYIKGSLDPAVTGTMRSLTYEVSIIKPGEMSFQNVKAPSFEPFYAY